MEHRIEVVTYDLGTGCATVDHDWPVDRNHRKRRMIRHARKWLNRAAKFDTSTDHVLYLREV